MQFILQLINFALKFDEHLDVLAARYGAWTYALLFAIVFCETGLVVTPILPGDSLLFAVGAAIPGLGIARLPHRHASRIRGLLPYRARRVGTRPA